MAHVNTFNNTSEEQLKLLKNSGCFELFIGVESGSSRILRSINKTHDIDKIIFNLSKVLKVGINIKGYFIYGFPGEKKADMELTYKLAKKLKSVGRIYNSNFRTSVFQYRPYHATEIYHDLLLQGYELQDQAVEPNEELSSLVGRLQFNFHTGNYSAVGDNVLHDYIYRTINLNSGKIFGNLTTKHRFKTMHQV
jgi:radical SAM superfamily enzyme YgiQ (UPF0313 family)